MGSDGSDVPSSGKKAAPMVSSLSVKGAEAEPSLERQRASGAKGGADAPRGKSGGLVATAVAFASVVSSRPLESLVSCALVAWHASFLYEGYVAIAATPLSGRASLLNDVHPVPAFLLPLLYLVLVVWLGQRVMKEREAINPLAAICIYNLYATVLSAVMFAFAVHGLYLNGSLLWTTLLQRGSLVGSGPSDAAILWVNYQSKALEMFDTIFFVLRKKNELVSELHVWHHAEMGTIMWLAIQINPVGWGLFGPGVNCFIHIIMYSYYLCKALGFEPWWKKFVTLSQVAQFCLNALMSVTHMLLWDRFWSGWSAALQLAVMLQMLWLFRPLYVGYLVRRKAGSAGGASKAGAAESPKDE